MAQPGDARVGRRRARPSRRRTSIACRSIGTRVGAGEPLRGGSRASRASSRATSSGLVDAVAPRAVAPGPTLMPTSGPREAAERVLVGDVVADEQHRASAPTWWRSASSAPPLSACDDRELDHALALAQVHAGQARGPVAHGRQRAPAPSSLGGPAVVQRDAGRLELDGDARRGVAAIGVQLAGEPVAQRDARRARARARSRRRTRCRGCRRGGSRSGRRESAARSCSAAARDDRDAACRAARPARAAPRPTRGSGRAVARDRRRSARACRRSRSATSRCGVRARAARAPLERAARRRSADSARSRASGPPSGLEERARPAVDVVRAHLARAARACAGAPRRRAARSRAAIVSLMPSMSCGLHEQRLPQLGRGAGELATARARRRRGRRDATYSLHTRFMPSRSGVTSITSAAA